VTYRIGIDVRKAADFGIGRYIVQLLKGLSRKPAEDVHYFLIGDSPALDICGKALVQGESFSLIRETSRSYSLTEHFSLPRLLKRHRIDLYHSTHYVLPLGPLPNRLVTSVHDLIHILFPKDLPSPWAVHYARYFIRRAATRSDAVITGSHTSRDDLLGFATATERNDNVHVIPYGVDSRFKPADSANQQAEDRKHLEHLGINLPYFLYVGNFKPHKNLLGALEAFRHYQESDSPRCLLVLVGRELTFQRGLAERAENLKHSDDLKVLGYQPDQILPILYRNAQVFFFPSLYEGFGLPPLEALACGTPVLAANRGSLPEVLGEAALFCDPDLPQEMAGELKRLTVDTQLARKLRLAGPEWAARYNWLATARKTEELYRALLVS